MGVMTFGFADIHHPVWPLGNSLTFEFRHMRAISSGSFVLVIAKVLARLLMSFPLYRQKNTSLPNVGNNDSHSDPFCAEQINASSLLYRVFFFFFFHIRETKVQIMKKTCFWKLLACWSNNIANLLTDVLANEETAVWFMRCFVLVDAPTFRTSCGLWEVFLEPSGYIYHRHCRIIL